MSTLIFDIETNGLWHDVAKVHCSSIFSVEGNAIGTFANQPGYQSIDAGLSLLSKGDIIVGHGIINYDLPVLKKIFGWTPGPKVKVVDTLVLSRLIHTNLKEDDKTSKKIDPKLWGSHSLKAWGQRMGFAKGSYGELEAAWETFSIPMADYCEQDVKITWVLYKHLVDLKYPEEAIELEHDFAKIISRQEKYGFGFNVKAAGELYAILSKDKQKLSEGLRSAFGSWYVSQGQFTPKRDNSNRGYTAGVPFTKIKLIEFNPASRDHISNRLTKLYGWKPTEFTDGGKPKVDESVLARLYYPNCRELEAYLMINKRLGALAEGQAAWLKLERGGRIYGSVNPNGAVTGRCTHFSPNVSQVTSKSKPYGAECRALFVVSPGRVLVGCDADGLELRNLAGFLVPYDQGLYVQVALHGNKTEGTDAHSVNQKSLQIDSRDVTKTFFYAMIYGAGNPKLGAILGGGPYKGKQGRTRLMAGIVGLEKLTEVVQQVSRRRGYLIGLDGRRLHVRSDHAALNTLLQGAGAVIMKKACVILDNNLQKLKLIPGVDYEFVANIHDEWQIETSPEAKQIVGEEAAESIRAAGRYFEFRCPLSGTFSIGNNWSETH